MLAGHLWLTELVEQMVSTWPIGREEAEKVRREMSEEREAL